jgi:carbamoyl-phosphate synthase large subunit
LTLDEIPYWREGTLDKYTPSGDYVVVKFARWAFEKFKDAEDKLGTQMRAVGEVMSIGKNYKEALQKAIRSLENGRHGLGFVNDFHERTLDDLMGMLKEPTSERQFIMYEALRKGADVDALYRKTHIKPWFILQMKELVELEEEILKHKGQSLPDDLFVEAKKNGFSDKYLAQILGLSEGDIRRSRVALGVVEGWEPVPVSGVENAAYYFSTYNAPDKTTSSERRKIMMLGGGPNRIGQGIEFDYCCVHAAFALRDEGYETIMVNCNPETVSTDYDTSDKLYFEPLTVEDILSIYEKEKPEGVIVQFGGQTPLNIAQDLADAGVRILGTSAGTIDLAEDRGRFGEMMEELGIPMPESGMASSVDEAIRIAGKIGYPLVMEHIELAGVHSGDSACVLPPVSISPEHVSTIESYTRKIAEALDVVGLMNIQYAIEKDIVYVLEANPRASRTVPLVSKVCGVSMARVATQTMLGKKLSDLGIKSLKVPHFGVKEAVFPFPMFPEVDPVLGPEMRSTGEVLGIAESFPLAFARAEEAAQQPLPDGDAVLITVSERDRPAVLKVARRFAELGFKIKATVGTHQFLVSQGVEAEPVLKMHEGRPNIVDGIKNGEISLIINTPVGKLSQYDDSYIRKSAVTYKVPYITTLAAATAAAEAIAESREADRGVRSLQSYPADIK